MPRRRPRRDPPKPPDAPPEVPAAPRIGVLAGAALGANAGAILPGLATLLPRPIAPAPDAPPSEVAGSAGRVSQPPASESPPPGHDEHPA